MWGPIPLKRSTLIPYWTLSLRKGQLTRKHWRFAHYALSREPILEQKIDSEIHRMEAELNDELEKRKRWADENLRRKQNYGLLEYWVILRIAVDLFL